MRVSHAIVFVSDMKRSVGFYRDVIGLPLGGATSIAASGRRWLSWAAYESCREGEPVDPGNIMPMLALLVGAVIVVLLLLRVMRARSEAKPPAPERDAPSGPLEEEEYLDSSHIMPGGPEAAARAAEALRKAKDTRG